MRNDYIINGETVAMVSVSCSCCRVFELDDCFEVNMSLKDIVELSCKYFGSSFNGRIDGSKYHLGDNYKVPIIIDEYRDIIIFPIKSYNSVNNCIISFNKINNYEKIDDGILLYTKNGKKIKISDSFGIFENQYFKAQKLFLKILKTRNMSLN